jgi:hypothetical protein
MLNAGCGKSVNETSDLQDDYWYCKTFEMSYLMANSLREPKYYGIYSDTLATNICS